MQIRAIFVQHPVSYPGQYGPELFDAVDELTDDDNPSYFQDKLADVRRMINDGTLTAYGVVSFTIPDVAIDAALKPEEATMASNIQVEDKES